MKKILSIILTALMLTASFSMLVVPASAANNTPITPDANWYNADATELVINDAADLLAFVAQINAQNTFAGKTVKLGADIDLNPGWTASTTAPTNVWDVDDCALYGFWGTFDGQGHTLSGIYLSSETYQMGLFGRMAVRPGNRAKTEGGQYILIDAVVKNVAIVNSVVPVRGGDTAGFYGYLADGQTDGSNNWDSVTFENVYNDIDLITTTAASNNTAATANYVGGFIGRCNTSGIDLNFKNCVYAGTIKLDTLVHDKVGGFVSATGGPGKTNVDVLYENCAFYGKIDCAASVYSPFSAEGKADGTFKIHTVKNSVVAGVVKSTEDVMESLYGSFSTFAGEGMVMTDSYYTAINEENIPFAEMVSVAPEGTTFCTHAELIGANAKAPAEGWTKTAGYAMPTALYTQFKALIDAQTPIVPDGTELGGGEQNDDKKEETPDNNKKEETETKAPETEAETTAAVTEKVEEGGCGGVIGVGAVAIVGAAAIAVARKKKED